MEKIVITSPELRQTQHGFFTRNGGVSSGFFNSLNCGRGSDDDPANVTANRQVVCDHIGASSQQFHSVHQVHSADVITVTEPIAPYKQPKADAMVTNLRQVGLGVLTADCAPVLFSDHKNNIVGAAHAGWKGALGGVIEATVEAMINIGAQRSDIVAVIGPCISQDAYEVGPEFVQAFADESPEFAAFFKTARGDRSHFDLPRFVLHRLSQQRVGHASWTGHCTYSNPERFFSYRWNTHNSIPDYGRMMSVITSS